MARVSIGKKKTGPWAEAGFPEKWVFIDRGGEVVLRPEFDYVDDFPEGFALVAKRTKDGFLVNYINKSGKLSFEDWFVEGARFSEGVAIVSNDPNGSTQEHYGRLAHDNFNDNGQTPIQFLLLDSRGVKIPTGLFEDVSVFSEGLAAVQRNGKWGYINKQAQIEIEPQFDDANDFSEGLASVKNGDKRCFINSHGEIVMRVPYDRADNFRNGLARVWQSGKSGYIDKTGKVVWKPTK